MRKRYQHGRIHTVTLGACVVVVFGVGIGVLIYARNVPPLQWIQLCILFSVALVFVSWLVVELGHLDHHRRDRHRARLRRRRGQQEAAARQPAKFDDRLANYLHRPTDEIVEPEPPYRSKMPFWCRVEVLTHIGPKSQRQIRRLLEHIRRAVQGRSNGHG